MAWRTPGEGTKRRKGKEMKAKIIRAAGILAAGTLVLQQHIQQIR